MKLPKPTRKNDKKQSLFESKQDVIDWKPKTKRSK